MNNIVGLFRKSRNMLEKGGITPVVEEKMRCPSCKSYETKRAVAKNKMVCPNCGHHYRIGARTRVKALFDRDSFQELFANISTVDPLEFPGYAEKMERGRAVSGETEGSNTPPALRRIYYGTAVHDGQYGFCRGRKNRAAV